MGDKDFSVGYAAGALIAMIGVALSMVRDDTIGAFRVPKETKKRLKAMGKARGWSMAKSAYICMTIGLDALEKEAKA